MRISAAGLLLIASLLPAFAQDVKQALNAAVVARFYRERCPGGNEATKMAEKWAEDYIYLERRRVRLVGKSMAELS